MTVSISVFAVDIGDNKENSHVTRAEFAKYFAEMLRNKGLGERYEDSVPFVDVTADSIYAKDVEMLYELGIINGDGNGIFRPDDYITYGEIAAMTTRLFVTDERISEGYPIGYVKYAMYRGVFRNIAAEIERAATLSHATKMIDNVSNAFQTYDIMEPLGCDDYNGELYVDIYPKSWQGYAEKPYASFPGYCKILPTKVLYSYDRETWNVAYEDIDGERVYYDLPENSDITGTMYMWGTKNFVSFPLDPVGEDNHYTYDYKTWYDGTVKLPFAKDYDFSGNYILGIDEYDIDFDEESGLYRACYDYEIIDYESKKHGGITLSEFRSKILWVSKDLVHWIGIRMPEEMKFMYRAVFNRMAQAIVVDGAVEFSEEEKAYLDNEEKIAAEMGLGYDKPAYKTEKYIIKFSDLYDMLDGETEGLLDFSFINHAGEKYDDALKKMNINADDISLLDQYNTSRFDINEEVSIEGKEFSKYLVFISDEQDKILQGGGYILSCDTGENVKSLLNQIQKEISKEFGLPTTYEGLSNRISALTDTTELKDGKFTEYWDIDEKIPYQIRLDFYIHEDMNVIDISCLWRPKR